MSDSAEEVVGLESLIETFLARLRKGETLSIEEFICGHPQADLVKGVLGTLLELEGAGSRTPAERTIQSDVTRPPARLGEYRLIREIGRGAMGMVYEAEQVTLKRRVALKVLAASWRTDTRFRQRFEREARSVARLHHTHIVPVYGVGECSEWFFYAMQLIDGISLDRVIKDWTSPGQHSALLELEREFRSELPFDSGTCDFKSLSTEETATHRCSVPGDDVVSGTVGENSLVIHDNHSHLHNAHIQAAGELTSILRMEERRRIEWIARIGADVADAVQHAHDQGILHRDIKPSNLLVDVRGSVWVTDFGLAKGEFDHDLTATGDIVGTPRYLAPEAFRREVDSRSDVYSLGLTLYELIAQRPAFDAPDRRRLFHAILHESAPPLHKITPGIPRDLVRIVNRAIEREPELRYSTAGDFRDDLRRFLADEPVRARPVGWLGRLLRWGRRNRGLASLSATFFFVVVAVAVVASLAAFRFRELANSRETALERARESAEDARQSRDDEARVGRQLTDTVDLALGALDDVHLGLADARFSDAALLNDDDRAFLERTLTFYERFVRQQSSNPTILPRLASAARRIGQIENRLGRLEQSVTSFSKAVDVWRILSTAEPANWEFRQGVTSCQMELGRALREVGRNRDAVETLVRALHDAATLIRDSQGLGEPRKVAAAINIEVGRALEALEKPVLARRHFATAIEEFERLVKESPDDNVARRGYASALYHFGRLEDLLASQHRTPLSVSTTRIEGILSASDGFIQSDPLTLGTDSAAELARSAKYMADALNSNDRRNEAEAALQHAVDLANEAQRRDTGHSGHRVVLAEALLNLARNQNRPGRWDEARKNVNQALQTIRPLLQLWPTHREFQRLLARIELESARDWIRRREFIHSKDTLLRIRGLFQDLNRDSFGHLKDEIDTEWVLYDCLLGLGDTDSSRKCLLRIIDLNRAAIGRRSPDEQRPFGEHRNGLLLGLTTLAHFEAREEEWKAAGAAFQQALEIESQRLVSSQSVSSPAIARLRWNLAETLVRDGNRESVHQLLLDWHPGSDIPWVDYCIHIDSPGVYRLALQGHSHGVGDDGVYVQIVELVDGPMGLHPDWYLTHLPSPSPASKSYWVDQGLAEVGLKESGRIIQPLLWIFDRPGDFTIRLFPHTGGSVIKSLQLVRDELVQSPTYLVSERLEAAQVYEERNGVISIPAWGFGQKHPASKGESGVPVDEWRRHFSDGGPNCSGDSQLFTNGIVFWNGSGNRVEMPSGLWIRRIVDRRWEDCLDDYLKRRPKSSELLSAVATRNAQLGKLNLALEQLDLALAGEITFGRERIFRQRAFVRWESGDFQGAAKDLERTLKDRSLPCGVSDLKRGSELVKTIEEMLSKPTNQPTEAFEALNSLTSECVELERGPHSWRIRGMVLARSGDLSAAESAFREALAWTPRTEPLGSDRDVVLACWGIGWTQLLKGNNDGARVWCELGSDWAREHELVPFPNPPVLMSVLTQKLGPMSRLGNAANNQRITRPELWQKLSVLERDLPWYWTRRETARMAEGGSRSGQSWTKEILESHDRLIERHASSSDRLRAALHFDKGMLLRRLRQFGPSVRELALAAVLTSDDAEVWRVLGSTQSMTGDGEEAVKSLSRSLEIEPDDVHTLRLRSEILERLGSAQLALHDLNRCIQLNPEDVGSRKRRSGFPIAPPQDALADLEWLARREPESAIHRARKALRQEELGFIHGAIIDWQICLQLEPNEAEYWRRIGRLQWSIGELAHSCASFVRALELEPDALLGECISDDFQFSRELLNRYRNNPMVWLHRGSVCAACSNADTRLSCNGSMALWCFDQAKEMAPSDPRVCLVRGRWLLRNDRINDAIIELETANHPISRSPRRANLGFEKGRSDWTIEGEAFASQPVSGDTVVARRFPQSSRHIGQRWIGTFENGQGDAPRGVMTSTPFSVTHDWGSFLVGGGASARTRVDIVRADTGDVIFSASGIDQEDMRRVRFSLSDHRGAMIQIRIVDQHSGPWGHINFDDFLFHNEDPGSGVALDPDNCHYAFIEQPPEIDSRAIIDLAIARFRNGEVGQAAKGVERIDRPENVSLEEWRTIALCRLAAGDPVAYNALKSEVALQYGRVGSRSNDGLFAWVVALGPGTASQLKTPIPKRLLEDAVRLCDANQIVVACLAMSRLGERESALEMLPRLLMNAAESWEERVTRALALLALGLTLHLDGHSPDALAMMNDAVLEIDSLHRCSEWNLHQHWFERGAIEVLFRELQTFVKNDASAESVIPTRSMFPDEVALTRDINHHVGDFKVWFARGARYLNLGLNYEADRDLMRAAELLGKPVDVGWWVRGPVYEIQPEVPQAVTEREVFETTVPVTDKRDVPLKWASTTATWTGEFSLRSRLIDNNEGTVFVRSVLYAEQPHKQNVTIVSTGATRIWLDGKRIAAFDEREFKLSLDLARGRNILIVETRLARSVAVTSSLSPPVDLVIRFEDHPVERLEHAIATRDWSSAESIVKEWRTRLREKPEFWARLVVPVLAVSERNDDFVREGGLLYQAHGQSKDSSVRRAVRRSLLASNHPLCRFYGREWIRVEESIAEISSEDSSLAALYAGLGRLRVGDREGAIASFSRMSSSHGERWNKVLAGLVDEVASNKSSQSRGEQSPEWAQGEIEWWLLYKESTKKTDSQFDRQ